MGKQTVVNTYNEILSTKEEQNIPTWINVKHKMLPERNQIQKMMLSNFIHVKL